jgi:hypothetical protein
MALSRVFSQPCQQREESWVTPRASSESGTSMSSARCRHEHLEPSSRVASSGEIWRFVGVGQPGPIVRAVLRWQQENVWLRQQELDYVLLKRPKLVTTLLPQLRSSWNTHIRFMRIQESRGRPTSSPMATTCDLRDCYNRQGSGSWIWWSRIAASSAESISESHTFRLPGATSEGDSYGRSSNAVRLRRATWRRSPP